MSPEDTAIKQNLFQDGPYLLAAVLCEHVLEEKDGVKTLVRIVDRIIQTATGENVPDKMPPFQYRTNMFITFKPGDRPGKYQLRIQVVKPNGERPPAAVLSYDLSGPKSQGRDATIGLGLQVDQEGLYWFEVYLDDMLATKVPLQVTYLIQTRGKIEGEKQTLM